ncbi:MAG: DUF4286 family protein [Phycisphaerales bacterium]
MTIRIAYMVIATLPSRALADTYIAWLEDGHVDAVINAGAHSAMIVRMDGSGATSADGPRRVMTQYIFPTREVFEQYMQKHAPALRGEGLKRFGPETGVSFERMTGEIV